MLKSLVNMTTLLRPALRNYSNVVAPVVSNAALAEQFPPKFHAAREVWIENFNTIDEERLGILPLHSDVFAAMPRIDVIHQNIVWQQKYRYVSFAQTKSRAEVAGGGRKPWPQKGGGRSRHGSIRSPLIRGGGVAHGPRSPTSHFYMLPFYTRVLGLTSALSVKLAQDDLHVVNDLEIPTEDPEFIKDLMEKRKWGPSLLMIDTEDIIPQNLAIAVDRLNYVNVMPTYGLNVYSMLKYDTLVMTARAVKYVEEKLLYQLNRNDGKSVVKKFQIDYQ